MEPTKYHNLWKTTGVFKYIYKDNDLEINAKDCNDLKLKLAKNWITLEEKNKNKDIENNESYNLKRVISKSNIIWIPPKDNGFKPMFDKKFAY